MKPDAPIVLPAAGVLHIVRENRREEEICPHKEVQMNKIRLILGLCAVAAAVSCSKGTQGKVSVVLDKNQISYGSRLEPNALTEKQLKDLGEYISKKTTPSQELWFIHVRYNQEDYLTATIYLKPQYTEGRIRKGQYFGYDSKFSKYKLTELAKKQMNYMEMELPEYMQVCFKDIPFGADLEIPPQNSLFPFNVPDGFSDEEIVEVIDFIRSGPSIKSKRTDSYYPETPSNSPIVSIEREGELIGVNTGSQEGPVSGGGVGMTIKKTESGYELISIGMWWS
jgi:hypothetical protein